MARAYTKAEMAGGAIEISEEEGRLGVCTFCLQVAMMVRFRQYLPLSAALLEGYRCTVCGHVSQTVAEVCPEGVFFVPGEMKLREGRR